MVNERKLAIPYPTIFICQLPKGTQDIIRKDLEQHAREHRYVLERDMEAHDYVGMTRRFCDIDDIYKCTELTFCNEGEDVAAYEAGIRREIILKLEDDDVDKLCRKTGLSGLSVSELLENFIADLIGGRQTNGSDERTFAERWFERCWFSIEAEETFLSYLLDYGIVDDAIDTWEDLMIYQDIDDPDEEDWEELQYIKEEIDDMFQAYRKDSYRPAADASVEEAMKKVMAWKEEKDRLKDGMKIRPREKSKL